ACGSTCRACAQALSSARTVLALSSRTTRIRRTSASCRATGTAPARSCDRIARSRLESAALAQAGAELAIDRDEIGAFPRAQDAARERPPVDEIGDRALRLGIE